MVAIVLVAALVFIARALLAEFAIGAYTGCRDCFLVPTPGADVWLLASLLGLMALARPEPTFVERANGAHPG